MIPRSEVRGDDARVGRLLAGLTTPELAALAGVGEATVKRLEAGLPGQYGTRSAILDALVRHDIRFHGRGDVRHADGRPAPTHEAVGRLTGERLVKARNRLKLAPMTVASRAHLTTGTLARIERASYDLTQRPTLGFVRLVRTLQLAGYMFGPWRMNHISGDRLLVEPPSSVRPLKDRSRYHTKGAHPVGLLRGLEEPAGED